MSTTYALDHIFAVLKSHGVALPEHEHDRDSLSDKLETVLDDLSETSYERGYDQGVYSMGDEWGNGRDYGYEMGFDAGVESVEVSD